MRDKAFIDTNIFLYAFSDIDTKKQNIAKEILLQEVYCTISEQVINECSVNLLKKLKLKETDVQDFVNSAYRRYEVVGFSKDIFIYASHIREQYHFSYFDSMIISSAISSNCTILYSEDMQHNQIIENQLKIINPFV